MSRRNKELERYEEALKKHDWMYDFSNNPDIWRAGHANETLLKRIAEQKGGEYQRLWTQYEAASKRPARISPQRRSVVREFGESEPARDASILRRDALPKSFTNTDEPEE